MLSQVHTMMPIQGRRNAASDPAKTMAMMRMSRMADDVTEFAGFFGGDGFHKVNRYRYVSA